MKRRFRTIAIENTHHQYSSPDAISAKNAKVLLEHFGQLVETVEWRLVGNGKIQHMIFKLLGKYCGETLKNLTIKNFNPKFHHRDHFPVLEKLILNNAEPVDFPLNSSLKHLEFQNCKQIDEGDDLSYRPWFARAFPCLQSVRLNSTEVTDGSLAEFLELNPQLRQLDAFSDNLSPDIFEDIGNYSTNIEQLEIRSDDFHEYESSELYEKMVHLSKLSKLTDFSISGHFPLDKLFQLFFENNTPLESFEVEMAVAETDNATATIPTIKTLKSLQCVCISNSDGKSLIDLVESQTTLQELAIVNMGGKRTIRTIEKLLRVGKNLTNVHLSLGKQHFDLYDYNRILRLARDRVKVRMVVASSSEINVPADILKLNKNWLNIVLYNSNDF